MQKKNRKINRRKRYLSNLSDGAWKAIKALLPVSNEGRPRELSLRQILRAQNRLSVASTAPRLSTLVGSVLLLPPLAAQRDLGAHS